jgi:hypothetical protein
LNWDVMLHGNPATDVFGAMKLGVGGELGMGVGEEEWGSGEREVLEDFARRTDGLVEMVVSRFGDQAEPQAAGKTKEEPKVLTPWMGAGNPEQASDGVIFSGIGPVSRKSLRDISHWMRWIYYQGEQAYGVKDNPSSARPKRKRHRLSDRNAGSIAQAVEAAGKQGSPVLNLTQTNEGSDPPLGIPRSVVSAAEKSLEAATAKAGKRQQAQSKAQESKSSSSTNQEQDNWMKYLTLGYGSAWGPGDHRNATNAEDGDTTVKIPDANSTTDTMEARLESHIASETSGNFLIGLTGGLDDESDQLEDSQERPAHDWNRRILVRTLYVQEDTSPGRRGGRSLSTSSSPHSGSPHDVRGSSPERTDAAYVSSVHSVSSNQQQQNFSRVRVLVYVHRPFIYTLLFDPNTTSLSIPTFYRNMHTFLAPLQQLLVRRTGEGTALQRKSALGQHGGQVWDLIHDADDLSICSTIPSIPRLDSVPSTTPGQWSRSDALNVHSAMLEIVRGTRIGGEALDETERSVKTARGWWVVWMKVGDEDDTTPQASETGEINFSLPSPTTDANDEKEQHGKDVILVRRARDALASSSKGKGRSVSSWGFGTRDSSESSGLAMGFDARKYVENLVGLGR